MIPISRARVQQIDVNNPDVAKVVFIPSSQAYQNRYKEKHAEGQRRAKEAAKGNRKGVDTDARE